MSVVTPCVSPQLARALAARLRDAAAAGEQLASFAFTEGAPAPGPELREGEELTAAHDFLLRVLHGVSDPVAWDLLAAVMGEATSIDALAQRLGLPRLVATERANALIQLGLMARDLERDSVVASPAGTALYELVCELDAEIAGWLSKRRRS
ncbi:MAG: hypothetical protein ACYCXW_24145 [Solirubrobacteraceae bacterium]